MLPSWSKSGLTKEAAKQELVENMTKEAETTALTLTKTSIDEAKSKANKEAEENHYTNYSAHRC